MTIPNIERLISMKRQTAVLLIIGTLAPGIVSCYNIACGAINGFCRVTVRDARGHPVSGLKAVWIDKPDDRFWRSPNRYEICTTDPKGTCSGSVTHAISRQSYGWSKALPTSNYSVAIMRGDSEIGAAVLDRLSSAQVSGRETINVEISVH
jgi:hypothetical protein